MRWKDEELFHVIHKVPAGDSPYVRAKRAQLVEKDPSRAISLFWAAINAGDRVDSALKDMAVVMKQLDRSEEAIEAIKSFRCLCADDSQESLDNVLLELYKVEVHINSLLNIPLFIYLILVFQQCRISGNLAWAYLQQNDYESAERYYM
ncbi:protein POLLENLESS 3 [Citrus sinensis]|uniref:Protein POLLENLESS 3 n=1 Tax=Citrus sinensis TaxID=2711 RepID=A0ACB8ND33_CITSI|nr:protein POLLENLESS 3 [Citrus sinensis]KAH9796036.1 protein POLLENLESS 3 [Citrus sinensis]